MTSFKAIDEAAKAYGIALMEGTGRGITYSSELLLLRATLFSRALAVLEGMDPRVKALHGTSIESQLTLTLLRFCKAALWIVAASDEVAWSANWMRDTSPTFALSSGLMANLMLTDPGKVLAKDIAWPFESFRIQLPGPDCGIDFTHTDGVTLTRMKAIHVLDWKAIAADAAANKGNPISLEALNDARRVESYEMALKHTVTRALEGMGRVDHQRTLLMRAYSSEGVSIFQNQPWHEDQPVSAWISTQSTEVSDESALRPTAELVDRDRVSILMAQRVAVNLALYLSSEDEKGAPVWTKESKSTGRARTWSIGSRVKVGPEVRRAAEEVAAGRSASAPSVRYVVRGHFRNQPCGTGRQDRKRIYITPFWKGPMGGPTKERTYEVT